MKKITFLAAFLLTALFAQAQYNTMSITGDGVGGWPGQPGDPGPTDVHQMSSTNDDKIHWYINNLTTYNGTVKFRVDSQWANNWGNVGGQFPSGTGAFNSQTNIPTIPGIYNVTFNSTTLEYNFEVSNLYPAISVTGVGVGGADTDVNLGTTDGVHYSVTSVPVNGTVKFRKDHSWATNWAAPAFPSGTAVLGSSDFLNVPNDIYNITFNYTTLEYAFNYRSVALVGAATPGGWPTGAPGEVDGSVMSTEDGIHYIINSITLNAGAAKFRENNSWAVQWGGDGNFPSGIGSQGGSDINIPAGTYSVTLDRSTGAYNFGPPVVAGTADFSAANFAVYPNPTQNSWNLNMANGTISNVQVVDVTGKTVFAATPNNSAFTIDASGLSNGIYFAKVTAEGGVKTVKLVKN